MAKTYTIGSPLRPVKTNASGRRCLKIFGAATGAACVVVAVGALLAQGAQPPDVTVSENFGRMFRIATIRTAKECGTQCSS